MHSPANGSLVDASGRANGNSGCCCVLNGVEVAVAVDEVFERRESEDILLEGSRKPPENGNVLSE
jgi:hypothetical protein